MPPLLRGVPRAVWAATAFFWAMLVMWSVAIPMFRGPDEADHVSAALYWSENHDWPGFKEMYLVDGVLEARVASGYRLYMESYVVLPSLTAADADEVRIDLSFDELGQEASYRYNKASQHPPLYSMIVGSVHSATKDLPWDTEMWFFRLVSVLLVCPLPLVAAAMARRLGAGPPVMVASALAICAVPQLAFVGGTVNNDNLLAIAGAWLSLGLVSVLTGDLRVRTAAWAGVAAAVALLAKAWALPLVAVVVIAYVTAGVREKSVRKAGVPLAVFSGISLVGGWWWIRNLFLYGTLQPSGHREPLPEPVPFGEAAMTVVQRFNGLFPTRFWSLMSIKTGTSAYPQWVPSVLILLLLACIVFAFVRAKRIGVKRTTLTVMAAPVALALLIMIGEALRFAITTGIASGIQGRYLYAYITPIMVIGMLGLSTFVRRSVRLPVYVGVFAVVFSLVSFVRAISYHYGDSRWANPFSAFSDLLAWSPIPGAIVVCFVIAVVGCAGWALREALIIRS